MTYEEFVGKIDKIECFEADGLISAWVFLVKTNENSVSLRLACFTGCDDRSTDENGNEHYYYCEKTREHLKNAFKDVSQKYEIIGCTYGEITD